MRVIKRYSNRKLYDTHESRYLTLAQLLGEVRRGATVRVVEQATEADLTAATLLQALAAEGGEGVSVEGLHVIVREGLAA